MYVLLDVPGEEARNGYEEEEEGGDDDGEEGGHDPLLQVHHGDSLKAPREFVPIFQLSILLAGDW